MSSDIELYSIRWWIILFLLFDCLIMRIVRMSVGIVNNIYEAYFQISYLTVDWFSLIQLPSMFLFSALMLLITMKNISNKTISIVMAGCVVVSLIFLLASYCYTPLYPLIFAGMLVIGLSAICLEFVVPSFTLKWFPENQVGIALSLREIFGNSGAVLAFLIPGNMLIPPSNSSCSFELNCTNITITNQENWLNENKLRLIAFSGTLLFVSIIVLLFLIFFMADQPPKPPTFAQAMLRNNPGESEPQTCLSQVVACYKTVKKVLSNTFFNQVGLIISINYSGYSILKVYGGEVLRELFEKLGYIKSSNAHASYVLVVFEIGCIVGSILSGQITNRYKNYHLQISISIILSIVSLICALIGYHLLILVIVYVFTGMFGVSILLNFPQMFDIVYQHLFPIDSGVLALVLRIEISVLSLLLTQITRFLMTAFGNKASFIYMIILFAVSFIVSLFLKPNYARLEAGIRTDGNENSETASLITQGH